RAKTSSIPEAMSVARTATRRCSSREARLESTAKTAAPLTGLTVTNRAMKEPRTKALSTTSSRQSLAMGSPPAGPTLTQQDHGHFFSLPFRACTSRIEVSVGGGGRRRLREDLLDGVPDLVDLLERGQEIHGSRFLAIVELPAVEVDFEAATVGGC